MSTSPGPVATSSADRMRRSLGACSTWTPFLEFVLYNASSPLWRKLMIIEQVYRISIHATTTYDIARGRGQTEAGRRAAPTVISGIGYAVIGAKPPAKDIACMRAGFVKSTVLRSREYQVGSVTVR